MLSRPGGGTTCQGSGRNATLSPLVLSVACYQEGDGDSAQAQLSPSNLVIPTTVSIWELSKNARIVSSYIPFSLVCAWGLFLYLEATGTVNTDVCRGSAQKKRQPGKKK